jgi:hypothetical protein
MFVSRMKEQWSLSPKILLPLKAATQTLMRASTKVQPHNKRDLHKVDPEIDESSDNGCSNFLIRTLEQFRAMFSFSEKLLSISSSSNQRICTLNCFMGKCVKNETTQRLETLFQSSWKAKATKQKKKNTALNRTVPKKKKKTHVSCVQPALTENYSAPLQIKLSQGTHTSPI